MIDPIEIIEQYYPKSSDAHYILLIHSEHVRDKALALAHRNPDLRLDTDFISEAAMLHDIGIFMCDAPRIHCNGSHQYIEHGYLGADILRKNCVTARHSLVCERHTGVGLSKETIIKNNLPLPHRDMVPLLLEEKLICYADKFFSKTLLKETHSLERIRRHLSHFGQSEVDTFNAFHALFER